MIQMTERRLLSVNLNIENVFNNIPENTEELSEER